MTQGIINQIANNPVWLLTLFFIVIAGFIVIGKAKGALLLAGLIAIYVLARKYWSGGAREAFEDISQWLAKKEFGPETENEKNAYQELVSTIPSVANIEKHRKELFNKLSQDYFNNSNNNNVGNMTPSFVIGLLDRLDHYFRSLYANLHSVVLSPEYPQHNMVFVLDTQRHILQTIHNFIFVDGESSDLPPWLAKSRSDLSNTFQHVNNDVAEFVNTHNSQPNVINTHSGFIASPNEPLPNGTYRSKYELY